MQGRSQFNAQGDRLDASVSAQNAQSINRVEAMNMHRRTRKIMEQQSAINAGFQDFSNVFAKREMLNMQSKELVLEALKSGDTEVIDRVAKSLGLTVAQLMETISDPTQTFN